MQIKVYHYPLCPFSRFLRVVLSEKALPYELICEYYWERRMEFLQLNPAGTTPVMIHPDSKIAISGMWSLFEFLEDKHINHPMIYGDRDQRARIRFITDWFCNKFYHEVTKYLLSEKVIKILQNNLSPQSQLIRAAKKNIFYHLDYIAYLLGNDDYLVGEKITLADYAAAAQLSTLDYLGDVPWEVNEKVKVWYSIIKSRPSFQLILNDDIKGINCSPHYRNLDF